jgi:hypothetical protein
MTVTIELPADVEAGLRAQAQAHGLDVSDYVRDLVREHVAARAATSAHSAHDLPPEEWVRRFEAWTHSHAGDQLPVLSDDAISRESIYRERGL